MPHLELARVRCVLGHRLNWEVLRRHLLRRVRKELRRERRALLARVRVHDRRRREGDRREECEEERAKGLHVVMRSDWMSGSVEL